MGDVCVCVCVCVCVYVRAYASVWLSLALGCHIVHNIPFEKREGNNYNREKIERNRVRKRGREEEKGDTPLCYPAPLRPTGQS